MEFVYFQSISSQKNQQTSGESTKLQKIGVTENDDDNVQSNMSSESKLNKEEFENWKGLGTPRTSTTKITTSRSMHSILTPQVISEQRIFSKLPILQNSYAPKTRNSILCVNTTLIDIVLFIISSLYNDNEKLRSTWNASKMQDLIEAYIKYGGNAKFYKLRTDVLSTFFGVRTLSVGKMVNCSANIDFILEKILFPNICSGTTLCQCKFKQAISCFHPDEIVSNSKRIRCSNCDKLYNLSLKNIDLNNVIFVKPNETKVQWNDIQKELIINSTVYVLCAIIELKPTLESLDYFVGHLLRSNYWHTYDHNATTLAVSKKNKNHELTPVLFVMTVYGFVCGDKAQTYYEIPQRKSNDIIHLQNFRINTVDSVTTHVSNSCAPDSLFQALSCLYVDHENFRDLCIIKKKNLIIFYSIF